MRAGRAPKSSSKSAPCPNCDQAIAIELAKGLSLRCPGCDCPLQPLHRAPIIRRCLAAILDLTIVCVALIPWWLIILRADTGDPRGLLNRLLDTLALGIPATILPLWPLGFACMMYFAACTWLAGRSVGQHVLGLRVVDPEGLVPGPVRALVRAFFLVLGSVPAGIGLWWSCFDAEGRAVHDLLAGTYVAREP